MKATGLALEGTMKRSKKQHILSRIIDCVKFCGVFELAMRGHDERESLDNPGIFHGLVDFVTSLELKPLDCMLSVVREDKKYIFYFK